MAFLKLALKLSFPLNSKNSQIWMTILLVVTTKNITITKIFMKKNLPISIAIILLLQLCITPTYSKNYYYKKQKNNHPITTGVDLGVLQRTLVSTDQITHQKFLDLGYRFSLVRKMNKTMSLNFSTLFTLDRYGIVNTNNNATNNYYYIHSNKVFSLSAEYNYSLGEYITIHPRIGLGMMFYEQTHINENGQQINSKKSDHLMLVGIQGKIHLNKSIAIGGALDYLQSVEAIKQSDKAHSYLNSPMVSGGLYITLNSGGTKKYQRHCPKF